MKKWIFFFGITFAYQIAIAKADPVEVQVKKKFARYQESLKKELSAALKKGHKHAVDTCKLKASSIAKNLSTQAIEIGRVSHRPRNSNSSIKPWMKKATLAYLAGKNLGDLKKIRINHAETGYIKPIKTGGLCLECHGQSVDPDLQKKIKKMYPKDLAVGFEVGDVRGFFYAVVKNEIGPDKDHLKRLRIERMIQKFESGFNAPTIKVRDMMRISKRNLFDSYVVVDVREGYEQKVSTIPGAITKADFEKNMVKYKTKKVISYCTIGYRSAEYTNTLVAKGFDALNLRGSVLSWTHEGGKLVDHDGKDTKKVHVYGKDWDLVPEGFRSVTKKPWFKGWGR